MSDADSDSNSDAHLESRLEALPMELLLQVLHDAFPQDERFNDNGSWESAVQGRRRRQLKRIIDDADESLPSMVRRAAQEVYVSCLQPKLVSDLVRELTLFQADPALGRAVRTMMLIAIHFTDANYSGYSGQAMPTDPLWPVYRQHYEEAHPAQSLLGFLSLPEWVNRWGVPLTRLLQVVPGVSILIVRLEDVASIPLIEFKDNYGQPDNNHLPLTNVKTLNLDQYSVFEGGGTLDLGGMLMRGCPHLQTLYLANIDKILGDGHVPVDDGDGNDGNNGESSSSSTPPPTPTRPFLTYLSTLHILNMVRLTPGQLARLLRMVGPRLQKVVAEIPRSGPSWKTQTMLENTERFENAVAAGNDEESNAIDLKESRGYTSREFLTQLLRWTGSLRSLSIKVDYKLEVRARRRELRTRRGLLVERPQPPTSLLPRFEGLESLEINSVLFWGLLADPEDGPSHSAIDDAINNNFGDAEADNANNANNDDAAPDFDGEIDSDDENDASDDAIEDLSGSLMHMLHTANLSPNGYIVPAGNGVLPLPENAKDRRYNPDKYVTDKLVNVLPNSLCVFVLHCPLQDGWFGAYACRPAVLGLLRAVRQGRFPHLHHIVVDPSMSVDDITTICLPNERKLVVQAVRADGFVNEEMPPQRAFAQAMTHLFPEELPEELPKEPLKEPLEKPSEEPAEEPSGEPSEE